MLTVVGVLSVTASVAVAVRVLHLVWFSSNSSTATAQPASPGRARARRGIRLKSGPVAASVAAFVLFGGGLASALFTSTDTVTSNQFGTGCFDAQVASTQTGQVTNSAEGTQTVAITAVDPATSVLFTSVSSNSTEPADSMIMASLASATQIDLVRRTDAVSVPVITVRWTVVEYGCGVSVQRGTTAGSGTGTVSVSITSVSTASSFVLTSSVPDRADAAHDGDDDHLAEIKDATSIELTAPTGSTLPANHDYAWQVITFADPTDASVQTATQTLSGTNSETITLGTAVDTGSTIIVANAASAGSGADIGERMARVHLSSSTTVEVTRQVGGSDLEVHVQVISFGDGTVVQHGILNMAAATSVDTVSTNPIDTTRATALSTVLTPGSASGGSTDMTAAATLGEASATFEITDPSTVTVTRGAVAAAASFAWQLIEWGGPNWWDAGYAYRQRIEVATTSTAAPTAYNLPVTIDHTALVNDGLARSDGNDLRVLRWDGSSWTELHRVLDDDSAWATASTTIWFRSQAPIAASSTDSYWLYYGNSSPAGALADPEQVWLLTEDFESGTLGDFVDQTAGTGWYQADSWTGRMPLTIQSSQVDADLTNYPVMVQLTNATLGSGAATDGHDIRFTAADGTTPLSHEIESWTSGTGALTAWVDVPAVSASTNTTIYLYYGAPDAPNQQNVPSVWAGVDATWHLAKDPSGAAPQIDDSSPGSHDGLSAGTMSTADLVTGLAGRGMDFDGTDDRLDIEPFDIGGKTLTVSGWVKLDRVTGDQLVVAKADDDTTRVFSLSTTGTQARFQLRADGTDYAISGGTLTTGTWYHLAGTWNGATIELFVDGISAGTAAATGDLHRDAAMAVSLGDLPGNQQPLDGVVEEVRLEPVTRSAAWLLANVRNLSSPSGFVSAGANEAGTWLGQGTWSYRKPVTVDSAHVSATLTAQPVLVTFVDAGMVGKLQTDGDDIVFTAADGTTRLDHQLESVNSATGAVEAWVLIPSVSDTVDTEFFVYYGNGSANNQQDAEAVFGSSGDLVFHGP